MLFSDAPGPPRARPPSLDSAPIGGTSCHGMSPQVLYPVKAAVGETTAARKGAALRAACAQAPDMGRTEVGCDALESNVVGVHRLHRSPSGLACFGTGQRTSPATPLSPNVCCGFAPQPRQLGESMWCRSTTIIRTGRRRAFARSRRLGWNRHRNYGASTPQWALLTPGGESETISRQKGSGTVNVAEFFGRSRRSCRFRTVESRERERSGDLAAHGRGRRNVVQLCPRGRSGGRPHRFLGAVIGLVRDGLPAAGHLEVGHRTQTVDDEDVHQ